MANETSRAPNERLNMGFEAGIGSEKQMIDLKHRFVLAGNWTGRDESTDLMEREPVKLNKSSDFEKVLKSHDLSLKLTVDNKMSEEDASMAVKLSFEELRDFEPDRIAEQIPEINQKLQLRKAILEFRTHLDDKVFRKKLEEILKDQEKIDQLLQRLSMK